MSTASSLVTMRIAYYGWTLAIALMILCLCLSGLTAYPVSDRWLYAAAVVAVVVVVPMILWRIFMPRTWVKAIEADDLRRQMS